MEARYVAENAAQRARLRTLVARLSDGDLSRSMDHGWTVGVALAHLAFWDRLYLGMLEDWEQAGAVKLPPTGTADATNDAMLSQWLNASPADLKQEVLAAAEAMDRKIEVLPATLVEAILPERPRMMNRSLHRREHLDEIERVLAS